MSQSFGNKLAAEATGPRLRNVRMKKSELLITEWWKKWSLGRRPTSSQRVDVRIVLGALAFLGALFVSTYCMENAKDSDAYRESFADLSDQINGIGDSPTREVLFWGYLTIARVTGVSLELAMFFLTFFFLWIKLVGLEQFTRSLKFTIFLYGAVLFALHEGTQFRISCGLALAIWSCVFITRRQWYVAILTMVLAAGFHLTAVLLPIVFFCCFQYLIFVRAAWFFWAVTVALYLSNVSIFGSLGKVLILLGGRYLDYGSADLLQNQNSTGLAFVYALVVAGILFIVGRGANALSRDEAQISNACVAAAIYGNSLIFLMHEIIVIGIRLSDVLLVLALPVMGSVVSRWNYFQRVIVVYGVTLFSVARLWYLFNW